jgi:hypothetical protein
MPGDMPFNARNTGKLPFNGDLLQVLFAATPAVHDQ